MGERKGEGKRGGEQTERVEIHRERIGRKERREREREEENIVKRGHTLRYER